MMGRDIFNISWLTLERKQVASTFQCRVIRGLSSMELHHLAFILKANVNICLVKTQSKNKLLLRSTDAKRRFY